MRKTKIYVSFHNALISFYFCCCICPYLSTKVQSFLEFLIIKNVYILYTADIRTSFRCSQECIIFWKAYKYWVGYRFYRRFFYRSCITPVCLFAIFNTFLHFIPEQIAVGKNKRKCRNFKELRLIFGSGNWFQDTFSKCLENQGFSQKSEIF